MIKTRNGENNFVKRRITIKELLKFLGVGCILIMVASGAPNALILLKPLLEKEKHWHEFYPSSLVKAARILLRKGLAEVRESKDGYMVILTKKGKTQVLKFDLENLEIKRPAKWDKKWRVVYFDIPNKFKKQRNFFFNKLKSLGFYPMQESVLVYPFDCNKEIKFIREVLGIAHFVKIGVLEIVENEEELKKIFSYELKHFRS